MPGERLPELVALMERLLAPDGCPWDREQTLTSLKPFLLEETHELLEVMVDGRADEHRDELGDVLFQVVFQAALAQRERGFGIDEVIAAIHDKLVRRHPHVFGDEKVDTAKQQEKVWDKVKSEERSGAGDACALSGVPLALPALMRAGRLGQKAAGVGFDWADATGAAEKVREELGELEEARGTGDRRAIARELGDLLFAVAQLARHLDLEPEDQLRAATAKFVRRFEQVEARLAVAGRALRDVPMDELDALWREVKRAEGSAGRSG